MINSLEAYRNAGGQQAKAQREHDQGRVSHFSHWFAAAINLEKPDDRRFCRQAFTDGYRKESDFRAG
jgi:hypothetical protein